jgi:DNA repair exonuclease SbcCD ATPase subunit
MLYGIDTRSKSTRSGLADKDRYAPWSSLPMEGKIDLNWQGRDITIERRTSRRIPLGDFSAYETRTGITVEELTASNCGQMLLGVEQSVFRRSAFIRHSDLPVSQDEALRRRLNALVTTGDENDAADRLAASLKELRNKVRYNRTGLLPQAEEECRNLEAAISEMEQLDTGCSECTANITELKDAIGLLENHLQNLAYTASLESAARVRAAGEELTKALQNVQHYEDASKDLPALEDARQQLKKLHHLQKEWAALQPQIQQIPPEPQAPTAPEAFDGMSIEQAKKMLQKDIQDYVAANRTVAAAVLIFMGILGCAAAAVLVILRAYLFAVAAGSGSLAALIWGSFEKATMNKLAKTLQRKYGTKDHSRWALPLIAYEKQYRQYITAAKAYREASGDLQVRLSSLNDRLDAVCGKEPPDAMLERLNHTITTREAHLAACREAERAQSHLNDLNAATKPVQKPAFPDELTLSKEETQQYLSDYTAQLHRMENLLGQYQGKMHALGDRTALRQQLEQKRRQIRKLENTYTALVIAQETLVQAKEELQRRFAPRITNRARQFMSAMTAGRYSELAMDTEFSLRAATEEEDTLRDILWRSDGTMDQLYLALRLAVAAELIPDAPLVLDDALVRFDDSRMKAAVEILKDMAQDRQIILFTCQGREELV